MLDASNYQQNSSVGPAPMEGTFVVRFDPVQTNQRPWREKLAERTWEFVRPIVWGASPWFACAWRMFWCKFAAHWYRGRGRIDRACSIARRSRVDYPWNFEIGAHSSIGNDAWVYALDQISIGANCCIGEGVRLLTGAHDVASPHFDLVTKPIRIGDNVWIATGAIVLPGVTIGVTIGEGAVVGAGAVVTKDIAPWTVVAGNPARVVKVRELRRDY